MDQVITPECRKQREGKREPSELVEWDIYDDFILHGKTISLVECLMRLRSGMLTEEAVDSIGRTLIEEIVRNGCCPDTEIEKVYAIGAAKYGERSWQQGVHTSLLSDAAWRHISWHLRRVTINTDDGDALHLAHALWQVVAIAWMQKHKPEFDDL